MAENTPHAITDDASFKVDFKNITEDKEFKAPIKEKQNKEVTGEISISDNLKDDENKKVKITFKDDSFLKDYVNQTTAEPPEEAIGDEVASSEPLNKPISEIRKQIIEEEQKQQDNFTADDYEMIAEFIIDGIDWGGSSLLMFIAKDNTDSAYVLSVTKKQRLKKQLARILIKMEVKFNFTTLFIISIILAYISPVKKALETRKIVKKAEKKIADKKKENENFNEQEIATPIEIVKEKRKVISDEKKKVADDIKSAVEIVTDKKITEDVLKENKEIVVDKNNAPRKRRRRGNTRGN